MKEIVFVRTRWHYNSYTDFWKLVELSGFPTCYVDEVNVYDANKTFIVSPMNGEWIPHILSQFPNGRKNFQGATLIHWNLERPGEATGFQGYLSDNMHLISGGYLDDVIVSDKALALQTGFTYVPLGSHPLLGEPGGLYMKTFDVIHLSCYSNHRSFLFQTPNAPKSLLGSVKVADNGWGIQRDENLKRSRFMLNVHQDGFLYVEPLRFALAAAYGLPVLTEDLYNVYPYEGYCCTIFGEVAPTIQYHTSKYDSYWYNKGLEFRQYLTEEFSFRRCLELCL